MNSKRLSVADHHVVQDEAANHHVVDLFAQSIESKCKTCSAECQMHAQHPSVPPPAILQSGTLFCYQVQILSYKMRKEQINSIDKKPKDVKTITTNLILVCQIDMF